MRFERPELVLPGLALRIGPASSVELATTYLGRPRAPGPRLAWLALCVPRAAARPTRPVRPQNFSDEKADALHMHCGKSLRYRAPWIPCATLPPYVAC